MCEVPKELGVSGRCLPFTKAMNDDSPSKCTTVSSVANATTPAAKWATSTTVLTNSTIPFNELEPSIVIRRQKLLAMMTTLMWVSP